jgi:hypothetical protein
MRSIRSIYLPETAAQLAWNSRIPKVVVPAKAGIQFLIRRIKPPGFALSNEN